MNGLTYDRYNRAIKVDGDTRVIMLVNGLQKDQEYIKNLNPERIREIEVMRNPGGLSQSSRAMGQNFDISRYVNGEPAGHWF